MNAKDRKITINTAEQVLQARLVDSLLNVFDGFGIYYKDEDGKLYEHDKLMLFMNNASKIINDLEQNDKQ